MIKLQSFIIGFAIMSATLVGLTGCGQIDRTMAKWTGDPTSVCYKGVEYVQFTSGASVAYNTDGSIKLCKD